LRSQLLDMLSDFTNIIHLQNLYMMNLKECIWGGIWGLANTPLYRKGGGQNLKYKTK